MENRVKVGQRAKNWDRFDEEAERQADAIHAATAARAMPNGKGKKVGQHSYRV